jgi:hypothetical protein
MAKASRAKRPPNTGLSEIHVDTGMLPVADQPFETEDKTLDMSIGEIKPVGIHFDHELEPPVQAKEKDEPANQLPAKVISFDISTVKFDINQKQIDEFKELVPTLVIKNIDDRAGYAKVVETRGKLKKARLDAQHTMEDLTEDAKTYTKAVTTQFKSYEGQLKPLEAVLQAKEDWFDGERKRIEDEKKQAETKRVQDRTAILLSVGCTYDGNNFVFGNNIVTADQLKTLSDELFETISSQIRMVHEEQIEQKRKDDLAAEQLRKENEAKQSQLAKEREEFQKQVTDFRKFQLSQIGFEELPNGNYSFFINKDAQTLVTKDELVVGATDWQKFFVDTMLEVNKLKAAEEQRKVDEKETLANQTKADADAYLKEQKTIQLHNIRHSILEAAGFEPSSEGFVSNGIENLHLISIDNLSDFDFKTLIDNCIVTKKSIEEKRFKAEKRRGDLRALGLTIYKDLNQVASFAYQSAHVFKIFVPDTEEFLLKRDDDFWTNKTLVGVQTQVAALKKADQAKITELLNEETAKRDATKGDIEKLIDFKHSIQVLKQCEPRDLTQQITTNLITKIDESLEKMCNLIDQEISRLTP